MKNASDTPSESADAPALDGGAVHVPFSRTSDLAGGRCLLCGNDQEVVNVTWSTEDWPSFLWFVEGFLLGGGLFWMKFLSLVFSSMVGLFSTVLAYVLMHLSSTGTEFLEISLCRSCKRACRIRYVLYMTVIVGGLLAVPVVLFLCFPYFVLHHADHMPIFRRVAIGGLLWVGLAYGTDRIVSGSRRASTGPGVYTCRRRTLRTRF